MSRPMIAHAMSTAWYVVAGALLIGMALAGTVLKRLPLTAAMFYLTAGAVLGPWGVGLLRVAAVDDASGLERITEIAVIISLFTAGLKLRLPASDRRWRAAILLATVAMLLTIAGVAALRSPRSACRWERPCCLARSSRRPTRSLPRTCRSRTSTMPNLCAWA